MLFLNERLGYVVFLTVFFNLIVLFTFNGGTHSTCKECPRKNRHQRVLLEDFNGALSERFFSYGSNNFKLPIFIQAKPKESKDIKMKDETEDESSIGGSYYEEMYANETCEDEIGGSNHSDRGSTDGNIFGNLFMSIKRLLGIAPSDKKKEYVNCEGLQKFNENFIHMMGNNLAIESTPVCLIDTGIDVNDRLIRFFLNDDHLDEKYYRSDYKNESNVFEFSSQNLDNGKSVHQYGINTEMCRANNYSYCESTSLEDVNNHGSFVAKTIIQADLLKEKKNFKRMKIKKKKVLSGKHFNLPLYHRTHSTCKECPRKNRHQRVLLEDFNGALSERFFSYGSNNFKLPIFIQAKPKESKDIKMKDETEDESSIGGSYYEEMYANETCEDEIGGSNHSDRGSTDGNIFGNLFMSIKRLLGIAPSDKKKEYVNCEGLQKFNENFIHMMGNNLAIESTPVCLIDTGIDVNDRLIRFFLNDDHLDEKYYRSDYKNESNVFEFSSQNLDNGKSVHQYGINTEMCRANNYSYCESTSLEDVNNHGSFVAKTIIQADLLKEKKNFKRSTNLVICKAFGDKDKNYSHLTPLIKCLKYCRMRQVKIIHVSYNIYEKNDELVDIMEDLKKSQIIVVTPSMQIYNGQRRQNKEEYYNGKIYPSSFSEHFENVFSVGSFCHEKKYISKKKVREELVSEKNGEFIHRENSTLHYFPLRKECLQGERSISMFDNAHEYASASFVNVLITMLNINPKLSVNKIREIIKSSITKKKDLHRLSEWGGGTLNLSKVFDSVLKERKRFYNTLYQYIGINNIEKVSYTQRGNSLHKDKQPRGVQHNVDYDARGNSYTDGDDISDVSSDKSGDVSSDESGDVSSDESGDVSGDVTGDVRSDESGDYNAHFDLRSQEVYHLIGTDEENIHSFAPSNPQRNEPESPRDTYSGAGESDGRINGDSYADAHDGIREDDGDNEIFTESDDRSTENMEDEMIHYDDNSFLKEETDKEMKPIVEKDGNIGRSIGKHSDEEEKYNLGYSSNFFDEKDVNIYKYPSRIPFISSFLQIPHYDETKSRYETHSKGESRINGDNKVQKYEQNRIKKGDIISTRNRQLMDDSFSSSNLPPLDDYHSYEDVQKGNANDLYYFREDNYYDGDNTKKQHGNREDGNYSDDASNAGRLYVNFYKNSTTEDPRVQYGSINDILSRENPNHDSSYGSDEEKTSTLNQPFDAEIYEKVRGDKKKRGKASDKKSIHTSKGREATSAKWERKKNILGKSNGRERGIQKVRSNKGVNVLKRSRSIKDGRNREHLQQSRNRRRMRKRAPKLMQRRSNEFYDRSRNKSRLNRGVKQKGKRIPKKYAVGNRKDEENVRELKKAKPVMRQIAKSPQMVIPRRR
ncbi:hypothetical protein POVCU2_0027070 [Plasmodium ovale curtisi]|uniref:subtilisin n=1 Tax=Plasmodium ovale curtisi TaxID=864141 RepID=A0A1A8VVV1_PLAOA|nr:hypothetical protein POVCU2_0027070 [Plasmodium ovale curtisi]